jgi:ferredoxin-NADP reductase
MLHALASAQSSRQVLWLHAARDGQHHPFAAEVRGLMQGLAHGLSYVRYSHPLASDSVGVSFNAAGHLSQSVFDELRLPREVEVYLCGPNRFMTDMKEILTRRGVAPQRIHTELFGGGESLTPGMAPAARPAPHLPLRQSDGGATVSFARSGVAAHWDASAYRSILELAEACDVPVRWSCRAGVCHNCESGLVAGTVAYAPEPLDRPAEGNVLICCSQPKGDLVVDL